MSSPAPKPRLVVIENGREARVVDLEPEGEWVLGRHADCAVVVAHPSIGRAHARLVCEPSGATLEDLKSRNGTFVNGKRIDGATALRSGDEIRLGQVKVDAAILLRFEDPTSALLDALQSEETRLVEDVPAPEGAAPAAEGAAPAPEETPAEGDGAAAPAEPAAPPSGVRVLLQPSIWAPILLVIALAAGVALWLTLREAPASRQWQSVRMDPVRVRPGGSLVLRASQIEPSDRLRVTVGDREAEIASLSSGELRVSVPDLGVREMGVRSVVVRVEDRGLALFQQAVEYEVWPTVAEAAPREIAVGDVVEISGTGFPDGPDEVRVSIGEMAATVLDVTPGTITARVPILTRDAAVEAPLRLSIGTWNAETISLTVRPKEAACYPMPFEAHHLSGGAWEIRHPFGPALVIDGPAPKEPGDRPTAVTQAAGAVGEAFRRAAQDPTLRFEAREEGEATAMLVVGSSGSGNEIGRASAATLELAKARSRHPAPAHVAPHWHAIVLNELLDLFARGVAPGADTGWRDVLRRLRERSVEAGGRGCPGMDEVAALSAGDRELLRGAAWSLPEGFGSASGIWAGELGGLRPDDPDVHHLLRLTLHQSGTALEGSARLEEKRSEDAKWSPPPIQGVRGKVSLRGEMRMAVSLPSNHPFRVRKVEGTIEGDVLEGTYTTETGATGRCELRRIEAR